MAAIENPQAITFCNTRARRLADLIITLHRTLPQFMLEVVRDFENLTGGDANGDLIVDGSAQDGRPGVTKVNVAELKFVVEQLQNTMNTDDRVAIVNRWAVNGQPLF